jgi:hypothetical protein
MSDIFPPEAYLTGPNQRHKRQSTWQIYIPLAVGCILVITLGVLVVLSNQLGNSAVSQWAAIAAIWLILPMLAIGIAALLVKILLIFVFSKINSVLPDYGRLARFHIYRLGVLIQRAADKAVAPGISLQAQLAGWGKVFTYFHKK